MRFALAILFPLLVVSALAQAPGRASLDRWRGLIIDQSTPVDAVKILGQPANDQPNETFIPLVYSRWFGNRPPKGFRQLTFKGAEGFDKADLYFKDDRLMIIELDLKKDLAASALVDAYDAKFYPLVGNFGKAVTPDQLAEPDRDVDYPDKFPLAYHLAAATEKTLGLAYSSAGFAESFAAGMTQPRYSRPTAISAALPGVVRKLQLISRTLESRKGTDLLK